MGIHDPDKTTSSFKDGQKEYLSENFSDLKLSGEKFHSTIFEECVFTDCDFNKTAFIHCEFIECLFSMCNLSVAKFSQCRFTGTVFKDCKAIGIDWTHATWPDIALFSPIRFSKCIISDSSFFGLHLNEIEIKACKAHDVDFRDGRFGGANFTFTDFSNSLFKETDLTSADFTGAVNYRIDINYNKIKKAKFSRIEAVSLLESLDIELID